VRAAFEAGINFFDTANVYARDADTLAAVDDALGDVIVR
jgi:aryl-alcohol dehydrogenase-like predicted oxidoreductase